MCSRNPACTVPGEHAGVCRFVMFGEVEGWRAFRVIGPPKNPRLKSAYGRGGPNIWPTNAWMHGKCPYAPKDAAEAVLYYTSHRTPEPSCTCGIYSAVSREMLHEIGSYHAYTHDKLTVTGRVGLSGRVIEATQGYRAEKARVIELFVPAERWNYGDGLRNTYGVPVNLDNTWLDFVSENVVRLERRKSRGNR